MPSSNVFFRISEYPETVPFVSLFRLLAVVTLFTSAFSIGPIAVGFAIAWLTAALFMWWINGKLIELAMIFVVFGIVMGAVPLTSVSMSHSPVTYCRNNMGQIMLGLLNYESAHIQFPPNGVEGAEGKFAASWRVHILPFVEGNNLYDRYRFDEPWDSLHNQQLANQMPDIFCCPSATLSPGMTTYKLVVGQDTIFDGRKPSLRRMKDGTSNTIMLVEDYANPVCWLKPEDISIDEAVQLFSNFDRNNSAHCHQTEFEEAWLGSNFATFDGALYSDLSHLVDKPEEMRKAFGIDDGVVALDSNGRSSFSVDHRIRYESYFKYTIYFVMLIVTMSWAWVGRTNKSPDPVKGSDGR